MSLSWKGQPDPYDVDVKRMWKSRRKADDKIWWPRRGDYFVFYNYPKESFASAIRQAGQRVEVLVFDRDEFEAWLSELEEVLESVPESMR